MEKLGKHFIEDEPRHTAGHVLDVEVAVTRGWWLPPLLTIGLGQILARMLGNSTHPLRRGLGYTVMLGACTAVHQWGHITTARMVEAPMDTILFTPVRVYTLYDDSGEQITHDQDVGRAIGGPVASIAAGVSALTLSLVLKNRYLRFFGAASAFIGLAALIPAGGNDGEVLFRSKNDQA